MHFGIGLPNYSRGASPPGDNPYGVSVSARLK